MVLSLLTSVAAVVRWRSPQHSGPTGRTARCWVHNQSLTGVPLQLFVSSVGFFRVSNPRFFRLQKPPAQYWRTPGCHPHGLGSKPAPGAPSRSQHPFCSADQGLQSFPSPEVLAAAQNHPQAAVGLAEKLKQNADHRQAGGFSAPK